MDYGKVLRRAWEITWRWKVLWVLGFLAALGSGNGGSGGSSGARASADGSQWSREFSQIAPEGWFLIAVGVFLLLLLGIAVWVISVIARGGLIAGVAQVEDEGSTTLKDAWRAGRKRFWTLFGIDILTGIPLFILVIVGIIVLVLGIVGGVAAFDEWGGIVPAVLCGAPLCCGAIVAALVLAQVKVYADRAAMLEGLTWIDAFKRGWLVLKDNLGPTIIMALIFFVIGLILAGIIGGSALALLTPLGLGAAAIDPGPWILAPICMGGLIAFVVFGVLGAIAETFTSATWTLTYRELTGVEAVVGDDVELLAEPVEPVDEE